MTVIIQKTRKFMIVFSLILSFLLINSCKDPQIKPTVSEAKNQYFSQIKLKDIKEMRLEYNYHEGNIFSKKLLINEKNKESLNSHQSAHFRQNVQCSVFISGMS